MSLKRNGSKSSNRHENEFDVRADIAGLSV